MIYKKKFTIPDPKTPVNRGWISDTDIRVIQIRVDNGYPSFSTQPKFVKTVNARQHLI
jgi:hypothetical protein